MTEQTEDRELLTDEELDAVVGGFFGAMALAAASAARHIENERIRIIYEWD